MTDYKKLVEALRCCAGTHTKPTKCPDYGDSWCGEECLDKHLTAAADAIEALSRIVDLNTERCEGLRKQLREAHEQYEKNINELEKELSFSESTYKEFQIIAATQNALLAKQLPKRGEWKRDEKRWGENSIRCSLCGAVIEDEEWGWRNWNYCYHCGAKMEVQDGK